MSVTLMATQAYPYAGRSLSVGDQFEASAKDAHILKLLDKAADVPVVEPNDEGRHRLNFLPVTGGETHLLPQQHYQMRDVKPDSDDPPDTPTPRVKRQYRRRDLVPEP